MIILALLTTYHTFAAGRCSHRGLQIDSTAESASFMSTRDNHVVGVMSRCESNESRVKTSLSDLHRTQKKPARPSKNIPVVKTAFRIFPGTERVMHELHKASTVVKNAF